MRSSTGQHYIALDHVRALAALLVFTWHFMHSNNGYPVPFVGAPTIFPLALFDEGHTGVALFMTLSGYLFAKLLDGKTIDFKAFFWNRALRLLPLLMLVCLCVGIQLYFRGADLQRYLLSLLKGLVLPTLPNGGWSITVEMHFYVLLPALLWLLGKSRFLPIVLVIAAILLRHVLHAYLGTVQMPAYLTLVGRIDQFVIGMLAFHFRGAFVGRHRIAIAIFIAFAAFYWYFDRLGGFYRFPSPPSPSALWIYLPTLEALAYGSLIAWYESSFAPAKTGISRFIGLAGEYSYSIYLLHFFVVFAAADFVDKHIMTISNFYVACAWSLVGFLLMMPIGYLSYRFVESPFLRLRRRYYRTTATHADAAASIARSH